jgi:hypothetical protein
VEDKECIQNFAGKTSWETFTWKIEKKMEYDIKMDEGDGLLGYCAM